jgi:hypothetical protein
MVERNKGMREEWIEWECEQCDRRVRVSSRVSYFSYYRQISICYYLPRGVALAWCALRVWSVAYSIWSVFAPAHLGTDVNRIFSSSQVAFSKLGFFSRSASI